MRVPRHFIDTVIHRTDIVDLIDSYVSLKKAGSEFEACCPFHEEKTPSFKVSPNKQIYHCFGCGAHGNSLTFLIEHQHLEFIEAVQDLAARAGLEMEYEAGTTPTVTEDEIELYDILAQAAEFFQQQLTLPQASAAQEYLQHRELNQQIVQEFGIGYAPAGWDNLLNAFGDSPQRRELLLKAGLIKTSDEGHAERHAYDFFRNRLMFPIHDARGRVIAFGGRVLVDTKKEAKYLNSPESSVFQKSHTLYGWHLVRQQRALSRVIVVEGYMDVVALAQYGIRHAVATLGTATSSEHIKQLFRRVPEVIFSFDGDEAGKKAAWKALEISLPVLKDGKVINFAFLPQGDDPDSFVRREGMEAFYAYLDQAVPLSQLLFDTQMSRFNLRILEGQVQFAEVMNDLLARLTPGVFQDSLAKHLEALTPLLDRQKLPKLTRKSQSAPLNVDNIVSSLLDKGLRLLVQQPHFAHSIEAYREPSLQTLHYAEISYTAEQQREYFFWKLLDFCRTHAEITVARVEEQYRDTPEQDLIFTFGQWKHLLHNEEDRKQEFLSIVAELYRRGEFPFCDGYRIKQLSHKWCHGQLTDAEKQEFLRLTGKRHESASN